MCYSYPHKFEDQFNELEHTNFSSHIFNEKTCNNNVPLSLIEKAFLLLMPEMNLKDIEIIFSSYANNVIIT